jgi:AraC-like DNA-binding protein
MAPDLVCLPPDPALRSQIIGYRIGTFASGATATPTLMSAPTLSLEIVFSSRPCMIDHLPSGGRAPKPATFVFGPMRSERGATLYFDASEPVHVVSVLFAPGVGPQIVQARAIDLTDLVVDAADALPTPFQSLLTDYSSDNTAMIVKRLDAMFLRTLADRDRRDVRALAGMQLLQRDGASICAVAKEVGLSVRQLERKFDESFGMSPVHSMRLFRFQRAVRVLVERGSTPLADLAAEIGYADQSHMARDFREFAGVPPSQYLAKRDAALYLP